MTTIDPQALIDAVQNGLNTYQGSAPAVLLEVDRNGLSSNLASGVTSIDSGQTVTPDARFEIGSQTKMMTATVAIQLASEGLFLLDDKLADIIDVAPLNGIANIQDVTLRQLMTHSSGIADYLNDFQSEAGVPTLWERLVEVPPRPVGIEEAIQFLIDQNAPAEFAPGERTDYSNTGFLLLQLAIEQATGNTLAEEFQTRIFDPLGMTNSSLPGFEPPEGIVSSYVNLGDGLLDVTYVPLALGGEGGVVSTTQDMVKFMKALVVDATLIPESYLGDLEPFFAAVDVFGEEFVGHDGGTTGTSSITLVHMPSGIVFSSAVSVAFDGLDLANMVAETIVNVLTNDSWLSFESGEGNLDFALAAADLNVSEISENQTRLDMQGVTLTLDGTLDTLEIDRFAFEDGSRLFISDNDGSRISVRKDAREAFHSDNQLIGQDGNDRLIGGQGDDKLLGNEGNDRLLGRRGDDEVFGGAGDDRLSGDRGADVLDGGEGNDRLFGNRGEDVLIGGAGQDVLKGGAGADILDGGAGNDLLIGGRGADTFVFNEDSGTDKIKGFESGQDKIDLSALNTSFEDLLIESDWCQVSVEIVEHDVSVLIANTYGPLTADDFLF